MNDNKISRRSFIAQNAALAGTALVSPAFIAAGQSSKKIRIGIVGGRFGSTFQWHEHPGCIVEAVSDLREDRRKHLMQTYKCDKSYPSLGEMVKDKNIDAIGVFTGAPDHVKHVILCMKHGKHVISAVPACGTLEEAEQLLEAVKKYGLTYMMAETGYYQQHTISVRKMYRNGDFGDLYYVESEYQHDGLDNLYFENGRRTWRYGMAPMLYPTHSTSLLIGVTGERLTEVVCQGWGDDAQCLKDNVYNNPFWNQSAFFKTDRGTSFRVNIWWKGAHLGGERANWIGTKMSFYADNGRSGSALVKKSDVLGKDDAGFVKSVPKLEDYEQPQWWSTDMLPEPLRHNSGHHGSHTFLTHEFIDALINERQPTVNIHEALAYTVPGIVAHESALKGGVQLKIPQFI
ncbi:MAG: Gfo/Idh/MocA family oxidoreductase [Prolixibacteraceae bacterium]|jgi:predicted dehydrogenase|nr:Gfo/Idh/MocA family oxidoreductase [Prolixibacteraceae bacterium]NLO02821.1 Gfo/Idh/MocA family oxidoreductase [Bacteroidales bacterium]